MKNQRRNTLTRGMAILMSLALLFSGLLLPIQASAKKKLTISKKKVNLVVGGKISLKLKFGKKNVTKKAKWTTNKKKVATVKKGKITAKKAGTAKITAKYKGKKIKVTVKVKKKTASSTSTTASTTASPTATPTATSVPVTTKTVNNPVTDNGFDWSKDVTWVDSVEDVHVEFTIDSSVITAQELAEQGYTINGSTASKDTTREIRTYTLSKFPNTLRGVMTIPLKGDDFAPDEKYGYTAEGDDATEGFAFNVAAVTVLTTCNFKGYANPSDPFGDREDFIIKMREMYEYLNGAYYSLANVGWQTAVGSMKSATSQISENVYLSYLYTDATGGVSYANGYTDPTEGKGPYSFSVYRGPYYIPAQTTITGERPRTYMMFVGEHKSNETGAENSWGSDRYIDVYKSGDGNWYSFDDQYLHITANGFRAAKAQF
ncbi:MAG: hypothetical protein K6G62_05470 [Eubacterium sp.]|nr:hypothetical protein [Eubacterium sp.]